ncbi:hypothetical protein [Roseisolibacter agri]|uniref:Uncharacterized protein n=1 Tax=Roseisolibacter agri TaxID=2014610 RepID=A0AA37QK50_9BACT|nr:hypothetical protein [Roseisolibacter agri]GLC27293.1 hypothetical protein rosag_38060 [Roseisolibacter agri]
MKVAVPVPPRDSAAAARSDSIRGIPDSLATRRARADSIQPPLALSELPPTIGVGQPYRWTRDSLFRTGSLTALDLLDRVPELTGFRTGWLASLQTASVLGDFKRLRVFRDGIELDPVDPRMGGALELHDAQLWQLEEVVIERAAAEVRLHMRTWSVRSTTPATRVDISTGDDDTNLYRGFFGRRFGNGGALQIGAQNFGSGARNRRTGGGGDGLSAFARVGWARGRLSIDAYLSRLDRQRNPTFPFNEADTILVRAESRRDEGYVRIGLGTPDAGPWVQAVANVMRFRLDGTGYVVGVDTTRDAGGVITALDTLVAPDSGASRTQYLLTGGFTRWGVRLSAADRWRVYAGRNWHSPAVRASFDRSWLSVSAFGERGAPDSTLRLDVNGRLQPLPWLAVLGAVSRTTVEYTAGDATRHVARGEVGVRLGRLWLTGGRVIRSGGEVFPPQALSRVPTVDFQAYAANPLPLVTVAEPRANGTVVTLRGRVYKDIVLDVHGTAWDAGGAYRPQYQTRAEVRLETNWLRRFPTGNFGLVLAITDEYRSRTLFPVRSDSSATGVAELFTSASNTLGALLEIRIQQATVSYQIRNALNREYELVPGIRMPRPLSFYGVRWYFFN